MAETSPKKKSTSKAGAKLAYYQNKLKTAVERNETLQAGITKMKRTFSADNKTNLMIAGGSGVAGVVVGYMVQDKIESSSAPAMAKRIMGIPTLTIGAAVVAGIAAWKLKGEVAAATVGLAGGTSGGAFAYKLATTPKKA